MKASELLKTVSDYIEKYGDGDVYVTGRLCEHGKGAMDLPIENICRMEMVYGATPYIPNLSISVLIPKE